jgi:hypothetical protein
MEEHRHVLLPLSAPPPRDVAAGPAVGAGVAQAVQMARLRLLLTMPALGTPVLLHARCTCQWGHAGSGEGLRHGKAELYAWRMPSTPLWCGC